MITALPLAVLDPKSSLFYCFFLLLFEVHEFLYSTFQFFYSSIKSITNWSCFYPLFGWCTKEFRQLLVVYRASMFQVRQIIYIHDFWVNTSHIASSVNWQFCSYVFYLAPLCMVISCYLPMSFWSTCRVCIYTSSEREKWHIQLWCGYSRACHR